MTFTEDPKGKMMMNQLMYEDLARAHMEARLQEAREQRRGRQMARAKRLARRAERVQRQTKLLLARSL